MNSIFYQIAVIGLSGCIALLGILMATRLPMSYSIRNLFVRFQSTLLTVASIAVAVAVLAIMAGFIRGVSKLTNNSGDARNILILSEAASDEAVSHLDPQLIATLQISPQIQRADGRTLTSAESYMVIVPSGLQASQRGLRFFQVRGVEDSNLASQIRNINLLDRGRWISEGGRTTDSTPEVILGEGLAKQLIAPNKDNTDSKTIRIGDIEFAVVGILKSAGTIYDSEIWMKRDTACITFGKRDYTSLLVRSPSEADAQSFVNFLNGKDEANRFTLGKVTAYSEKEYYRSLRDVGSQLEVGTSFVAITLAIGCALGILSCMLASVHRRLNDIHILRLLGYSRTSIFVCLLLESLVIAIMGGMVGIGISKLANGWDLTSTVGSSAGVAKAVVFQIAIDGYVIAMLVCFTLLVGFLGGLIPAIIASFRRTAEGFSI